MICYAVVVDKKLNWKRRVDTSILDMHESYLYDMSLRNGHIFSEGTGAGWIDPSLQHTIEHTHSNFFASVGFTVVVCQTPKSRGDLHCMKIYMYDIPVIH
jgi:hypothetical protein